MKENSKVKSKTKPSEFCKNILKFSKVKSTEFITDYFSNVDDLINAIFEYKRLSNIPSGEKCLADLLVKKRRLKYAFFNFGQII